MKVVIGQSHKLIQIFPVYRDRVWIHLSLSPTTLSYCCYTCKIKYGVCNSTDDRETKKTMSNFHMSNEYSEHRAGSRDYVESNIKAIRHIEMICASKTSTKCVFYPFQEVGHEETVLTFSTWQQLFFRARRIFFTNGAMTKPFRVWVLL